MEATTCISLQHVHKYFGKKHILQDINIVVPYGEIYGILGPSGCGKTTTVKVMAGILEADQGEVLVLGEGMPKLSVMEQIGYMAQSDALYPTLSGKENMEFFGGLYGLFGRELQQRMEEALELVDLCDHADKPINAYSGGMKRRLSLAMAVLNRPKLLILDEPTVGIDPLLRRSIWESLHRMTGEGTTILVTTHVMDEAAECHRLAMMREGILLGQGSPAEIIAAGGGVSLEQAFITLSSKA